MGTKPCAQAGLQVPCQVTRCHTRPASSRKAKTHLSTRHSEQAQIFKHNQSLSGTTPAEPQPLLTCCSPSPRPHGHGTGMLWGMGGPGDPLPRDPAPALTLKTLQKEPAKAPESRLPARLLAPSPDGLLGCAGPRRAANALLSIYITRNA